MNAKTNKKYLVLFVITVIAAPLSAVAAQDKELINVAGTVGNPGGGTVSFDLINANGVSVGSSSYTTSAGDSDGKVANKLDSSFVGAGFSAIRLTDKADGTEVLLIKRKRNGGQPFTLRVNLPGEPSITVNTKDVAENQMAMFVQPDAIDRAAGFALITLTGEGTNWLSQPLTGIDFGDDIFVDSFDVLSDDLIVSNISWDPGTLALGAEHVVLLGDYVDDFGLPEHNIGYDLSWNPLDVTPEPGSLALIALGAFALTNRRRRQPLR